MSVYNPTGSGNVHMDKSISGGRKVVAKKAPAKKLPPFMQPKKGTKKAAPKKSAKY